MARPVNTPPSGTEHAPSAAGRLPSVIVALDVPSLAAARNLVERLGDGADFYKVGLQLFSAEGPSVVEWLHRAGKRVFLDLKLHDIPNTVRGAAQSAATLGVELLTVHAIGGASMIAAAVEGGGSRTGILAVTVLTSMKQHDLEAARGAPVTSVGDEVVRLAGLAAQAGAHGVVCAGAEVTLVRHAHRGALRTLVPGIRLGGAPSHDQARVMTPREAAQVGASYIVIGRTVTAAEDPREAMDGVKRQMIDG